MVFSEFYDIAYAKVAFEYAYKHICWGCGLCSVEAWGKIKNISNLLRRRWYARVSQKRGRLLKVEVISGSWIDWVCRRRLMFAFSRDSDHVKKHFFIKIQCRFHVEKCRNHTIIPNLGRCILGGELCRARRGLWCVGPAWGCVGRWGCRDIWCLPLYSLLYSDCVLMRVREIMNKHSLQLIGKAKRCRATFVVPSSLFAFPPKKIAFSSSCAHLTLFWSTPPSTLRCSIHRHSISPAFKLHTFNSIHNNTNISSKHRRITSNLSHAYCLI